MVTRGFNVPGLLWILFHLPATNGCFPVPGPELSGMVRKCITLNTEMSIYARKSSPSVLRSCNTESLGARSMPTGLYCLPCHQNEENQVPQVSSWPYTLQRLHTINQQVLQVSAEPKASWSWGRSADAFGSGRRSIQAIALGFC